MDKQEFLETLRNQLATEISPQKTEENIRYYDEYISEELRSGKSQGRILEELGSPFLIARTIIDTSQTENEPQFSSQGKDTSAYQDSKQWEQSGNFRSFQISKKKKWAIIAVLAVMALIVLSLLGSMIAFVARFFIPILIVVLIFGVIKRRGS